jgi:alkylhydroperoxidase family enzyme
VAFIAYRSPDELPESERVPDPDHIIQIHSVHPAVMRQHYDLYRELMYGPGSLTRREREVIAVRVSGLNDCPY